MTDELKIFGKVMISSRLVEGFRYRAKVGIFSFAIQESAGVGFTGEIAIGVSQVFSTWRRWDAVEIVSALESEARRIMRECLEIAGPIVATFDANGLVAPVNQSASRVTFWGDYPCNATQPSEEPPIFF